MTEPLNLAAIGCGGRSTTYLSLAAKHPERYRVVAAADPVKARLDRIAERSNNSNFQSFADDAELLAQPQLADVMIIGTQDALHREHAIAAMRKGYNLLLEKPISTNMDDITAVHEAAKRYGRRVMVCHVLRYTSFYRKIKSLLDEGHLGDLVSINATEGVEAWHQAHSYVRGHWAVEADSSPMILGKSCHDLDIIRWIVGSKCQSLSSFGNLMHFTFSNKPEGAPERCLSGCPVGDSCIYNAARYLGDQRGWTFVSPLRDDCGDDALREWLHQSPWGRCVYQCGNDAVDHQTVNMLFDGGVTATFTMTAFDEGRSIEIFGTKARLIAGHRVKENYGCDIIVKDHASERQPDRYSVGDYDSHMGGDAGLVDALYGEMSAKDESEMTSSLDVSVESHQMAFAAEESRRSGETIRLR